MTRVSFSVAIALLIAGCVIVGCVQDSDILAPDLTGSRSESPAVVAKVQPSGTRTIQSAEALQRTPLSITLPDGRVVERHVHIFYEKGFSHKPNHNGGGGGTGKCYAFMSGGIKWKTTEPYVLDTTNGDGLSEEFVASSTEAGLNAWDDQVAFDIFGSRDIVSIVDGADTQSPDGKNEIFFGSIEDPGVIAVTIVWRTLVGKTIVEYDMIFDDPDFTWGDAGPTDETGLGNTSVMDYQNVATHEIGHAAGLAHPSDSCTEETMYRFAQAGETKKRTLNTGDIAGIKALYK